MVEFYAKHKNNRIAKSNQTLFLMDLLDTGNSKKSVRFDVKLSSDFEENQLSDNDIIWYYRDLNNPNDQIDLGKNFGKKFLQTSISEKNESVIFKIIAGNPNSLEKQINIRWIDEYRKSYDVVPAAIKNILDDIFKDKINKINDYLPGPVKFETGLNITGEQFNAEDENSRNLIDTRKGSISATAGVSVELGIPGLSVQIPYIGTLGGYVKVAGNMGAEYELEKQKYHFENDSKYQTVTHAFGPVVNICLELGAKVELLPDVELIVFDIRAYGKGCFVFEGDLKINTNSSDQLTYEIYVNPLIGGVSAKIEAAGFEVFDQSYEQYIFSRIPIDDGQININ